MKQKQLFFANIRLCADRNPVYLRLRMCLCTVVNFISVSTNWLDIKCIDCDWQTHVLQHSEKSFAQHLSQIHVFIKRILDIPITRLCLILMGIFYRNCYKIHKTLNFISQNNYQFNKNKREESKMGILIQNEHLTTERFININCKGKLFTTKMSKSITNYRRTKWIYLE